MPFFSQYPLARQALEILDRQAQWSPTLEKIVSRYDDTPEELRVALKEQMEEALVDMASLIDRMPDAPIGLIMARRLSLLDCFYTRATKKGAAGSEFWNPLEESFPDFAEQGEDAHFYIASERFPASDIIKKWSKEHLQ